MLPFFIILNFQKKNCEFGFGITLPAFKRLAGLYCKTINLALVRCFSPDKTVAVR